MESKKKQSIHDPIKSSQIDNDAYEANMEIQERFYEEDSNAEEDVKFSVSNTNTFGAFILPKDI